MDRLYLFPSVIGAAHSGGPLRGARYHPPNPPRGALIREARTSRLSFLGPLAVKMDQLAWVLLEHKKGGPTGGAYLINEN